MMFFITVSWVSAASDDFLIVSETGSQDSGIQVDCPSGYTVTGGGFSDKYYTQDDQDASYPVDNGWYCEEDRSNPDSECYAVCWNSDLVFTDFVKKTGSQKHGIRVDCENSIMLGGGFEDASGNNDDQDYNHPVDNGWYCEEDRSDKDSNCYAVCGEATDNYEMTCETVSVQGSFKNGVEVMCAAGTYVVSGGFEDASGNNDDQDYNHPVDNGWYCEEDRSDKDSNCYARCCSFELKCVENIIDGFWSEWGNVSDCINGSLSQVRTRTEYDENECGNFVDVLHSDYRTIECGEPECYSDIDCGISHCAGEPNYCFEGNVYQNFVFPECVNAGEISSYCSYELILPWMIQDCYWGCFYGNCLAEEDIDLDDDGYNYTEDCNDDNYYVNPGVSENCSTNYDDNCNGEINEGCIVECTENIVNGSWSEWGNVSDCINGSISQMKSMIEFDINLCGTFENITYKETRVVDCLISECCSDENCSEDYYGERYCSGDDIYKTFHNFSCVNGTCVDNETELFVKECSYNCVDGGCKYKGSSYDDDDPVIYFSSNSLDLIDASSPSAINLKNESGETSLIWLWILILGILILILIWAIVRIM